MKTVNMLKPELSVSPLRNSSRRNYLLRNNSQNNIKLPNLL